MTEVQPVKDNLSRIIQEASEVRCQAFTKLIEKAARLLCKEDGKVGRQDISGRLIRLKPSGEALVIGDLHGDLESLVDILKQSGFIRTLDQAEDAFLIFLGDYGDRGSFSVEVYYTALSLKLLFPRQVILLRGNHEGPEDLTAQPNDLPEQFKVRFGKNWTKAYAALHKLFACMYNAVLVEERYLLIHGGLPLNAHRIKDLAYAHNMHPQQDLLEDMLWSDPSEIVRETCASPRGAGRLFSANATDKVLERFHVKILIRGHEPCTEGFKIDHNAKILTLFSRKGPPYFNAYGAYLDVDLREKPENAEQLVQYVHRF